MPSRSHPKSTRSRSLCTSTKESPIAEVITQPPMVIRSALIGATVGFGTPFFAVGGVANIWCVSMDIRIYVRVGWVEAYGCGSMF